MKQKLLTLFTLLLTVCSGAWADELAIDKSSSDWTSGSSIGYTNSGVTISSGNNAKSASHKWGEGSTNVAKVYIQVSSKPFYIKSASANITKIEFIAWANNSSASNACDVKSSSTEDGTYSVVNSNFTATKDGATLASLTNINIAGYDAAGTDVVVNFSTPLQYIQIAKNSKETWIGTIKVWIADEGVKKPSFSVKEGTSIVKNTESAVTLTSAGNTIYYKWNTTADAYATGAALEAAADGNGASPVAVTAPSTTGTTYLYAVAKDGEGVYSDIVSRSYTITNQTYNISYANGGGSGEMSNTIVEEGDDQVLPANTFTRDCYSFAGWVADVDVKISGATVTAGEIIDDEATIEDVTENIALTAQWTASYASGKYDFQTGATIGTSPSKTVTTTDTDYAAFQIDNLYFSAMKIGYDDGGSSGTGDGVNFNGWKLKTKNATIKFVVESDKLVTIGIGSIGSGGAAKIDYTNLDGESATASFSAGTNHNYLVKGGTLVTITHNGTDGKTVTLKKIFIQDYVPVTISDKKYATFASGSDLDFPSVESEGLYAYTAEAANDELTFTKVTGSVKAGEGLLLYANVDAQTVFYVPVATDSPAAVSGNKLVRGTGAAVTSAGEHDGEYNYVLSTNGEGEVNFYRAAGKEVGTDKAYLKNISATATSKFFLPTGEDETDGIRSIENSELRIESSNYYNLAGQRVGKDYKGIVIVNGKKIVRK